MIVCSLSVHPSFWDIWYLSWNVDAVFCVVQTELRIEALTTSAVISTDVFNKKMPFEMLF